MTTEELTIERKRMEHIESTAGLGQTTAMIIEQIRNICASNQAFRNLIIGEDKQPISEKEAKKCFVFGQEVRINRKELTGFPRIQLFKIRDMDDFVQHRISAIQIGIQVNSKTASTAMVIGDLFEEILEGKNLTLRNEQSTLMPLRKVSANNVPSNMSEIHSYLLVVETKIRKPKEG